MSSSQNLGAQSRAANPATSAWVSAAAGTGKTRVLRDRVLRLLLGDVPPARILCLTYTNAAAAEMANRVNDALAEWVTLDDEGLARDLNDIGVTDTNAEILATARRLFADVLETPGGMKIQTLHAFCQSVLARFPLEAHMAPHFTLMEEGTAKELQMDALDNVFADVAGTPQPALQRSINYLAHRCADGTLTELVTALFGERHRLTLLWEQANQPGAPDIDTALATRLGFDGHPNADALLEAACEDGAFHHVNLQQVCRAQLGGSKTEMERGQKIADWLAATPADRVQHFDTYCSAFFTQKGEIAKRLAIKSTVAEVPNAIDILTAEAERLKDVRDAHNMAEVWTASSAIHRLGKRVLDRFEVLKVRQALMDYTDLILKTQALFASPGIAPWVLYKLDGGLDHILVDEAQDTSPEQWSIIGMLVDEFFSGDSARDIQRTVFAVGDVQQSIYGFQGAAPDQFKKYQHVFGQRARDAGEDFRTETLDLTYRTAQPVLDVVNAVFDQTNRTARTGVPGLVELWPVASAQKAEDDEEPWTPPLTQREVDDPAARCAQDIATQIDQWLKSGARLSSDKAIAPGDIMILVRRRNEFVGHMIRALKVLDIPVAGADRMVLTEQLAVMDLTAAAAFALLPGDDLTLACVLKGPFAGLSEEDLFSLANPRKGSLWDELRQRRNENPAFEAAHSFLADLLAQADNVPPFEFFSHILTAHDGRGKLISRLGTQAIDPLEEFLNLTIQFEETHTPSLQEFLHWLASGEFIIKRSSDGQRDEVRVMTVHGAKGLEAPIVFLPDTCGLPQKKGKLMWMEDEGLAPIMIWPPRKDLLAGDALDAYEGRDTADMDEYDRLLYVAMTRAKDRLYVTGWEKKKRKPECWYERIKTGLDSLGDAVTEQKLDDETTRWCYGSTGDFTAGDMTPPVLAEKSALPSWLNQPPPLEPTPPRPLTPSRPREEDPPVASPGRGNSDARFRRGRILHRLLELLPELKASDRANAGMRFLEQQTPALTSEDQQAYLDEVMAIIDHPDYAAFFGPRSAAEIPIVGVVQGRPVTGQVDRLAVTDSGIYIIDFKTNRPAPMTVEFVPTAYMHQMATYREILRKIYPDKPIICALLWTEGPRLLTLPDAALSDLMQPSP